MSQSARKNVYQSNEKLELFSDKGNVEGVLEKDDAVYVIKNLNIDGKDCIRFRVIKFWQTPNEHKTYTCPKEYFRPYEEELSSVDSTETVNETTEETPPKKVESKKNNSVPILTGLGFGTLSYFIAKKFGKSGIVYGLIGLAGGVALGYGLLKYHNKK